MKRSPWWELGFCVLALTLTWSSLALLGILFGSALARGATRLSWQFLTSYPSRFPEKAGILSAWVGTCWVITVMALLVIPVAVGAAIYLEEYAPRNWLSEVLEVVIANLAGVPSIIYGILGLSLFVRQWQLGRSVLAGALTLGLLVLPILILSTREALRAVPWSLREAALAVGASHWQTIRDHVLPAAQSGIFTGIILAISRAIGETAPLITIGALTYVAFLPTFPLQPTPPYLTLRGLLDPFTVLPIQIFNWVSRPQAAFHTNAAAAIVVLLALTLGLNGLAIVLRARAARAVL